MSDQSNIGWTDATWPIVQGCEPVDGGCANCYSVFDVWRQQNHPNPKISAPIADVVRKDDRGILSWTGKVACREDRLEWPLRWKEPRMIFVPSLGDLFHPAVPDEFIDKVFAVMAMTPQHTYQVLTRRTKRAQEYLMHPERIARIGQAIYDLANWNHPREKVQAFIARGNLRYGDERTWPLPNIWLGASVPDQARANRLFDLLSTPAAVHFVSYEPALEFVDFTQIDIEPLPSSGRRRRLNALDGWISVEEAPHSGFWRSGPGTSGLGWGIIGGESIRRKGKDARPFHLSWAYRTVSDFRAHDVPLFVKQLGHNPVQGGDIGAGFATGYPITGKGTDPAEWPEDLRVQEFPKGAQS